MLQKYHISVELDTAAMEESEEAMEAEVETVLEEAGINGADISLTQIEGYGNEINGPRALLRFKPQRQSRTGQIESVDTDGRTEFFVPLEDVLTDEGEVYPSPSHALDELKTHRRAPLGVQLHSGPYDLRIVELQNLPDDKSPEDYGYVV